MICQKQLLVCFAVANLELSVEENRSFRTSDESFKNLKTIRALASLLFNFHRLSEKISLL
jgi:hypothetical protein